jgi:hypothetical protein
MRSVYTSNGLDRTISDPVLLIFREDYQCHTLLVSHVVKVIGYNLVTCSSTELVFGVFWRESLLAISHSTLWTYLNWIV